MLMLMMVFLKCLIQNKPEKIILDVQYFYHYCSALAIKGFLEYMVLAKTFFLFLFNRVSTSHKNEQCAPSSGQ